MVASIKFHVNPFDDDQKYCLPISAYLPSVNIDKIIDVEMLRQ